MRSAPRKLSLSEEGDAILVERARGGDESAFATLFKRHASYVAGVAYRILGDQLEVDDVVQETFIRAVRGLPSVHTPERVRPWLVQIAVRRVHRRLSRRRRRAWFHVQLAAQAPRVSDPRERSRAEELYAVLDRIPASLRIPWVLARIEGHELADVASACDVSLATVKRRIGEADERIERRLHEG